VERHGFQNLNGPWRTPSSLRIADEVAVTRVRENEYYGDGEKRPASTSATSRVMGTRSMGLHFTIRRLEQAHERADRGDLLFGSDRHGRDAEIW